MKKITTFIAIIGFVLMVAAAIHAVNWGNTQMEKTRRDNARWEMNWMNRR